MRHLTLHTLAALTLAAAVASPLLAEETVEQCVNRVTRDCDAALADSNWFEKVAVGIVCTGMYAACGGIVVNLHLT
jgi:hypothetical protein